MCAFQLLVVWRFHHSFFTISGVGHQERPFTRSSNFFLHPIRECQVHHFKLPAECNSWCGLGELLCQLFLWYLYYSDAIKCLLLCRCKSCTPIVHWKKKIIYRSSKGNTAATAKRLVWFMHFYNPTTFVCSHHRTVLESKHTFFLSSVSTAHWTACM